jgi:2-succinyl-6-hydroxy-2,4-cyclohexadiene-1-carboxylate synthase
MAPIIDPLAEDHRVVALDLVGHGESHVPGSAVECSMESVVGDVDRLLKALALDPVHIVGYSMGGRVALSYLVGHADRVASLTAIGASPGIADPAERADRLAADADLADQIEQYGIAWFVDYWSSLPILQPGAKAGAAVAESLRRARLTNDPMALAGVLRGLGTGSMPPLHDKLAHVELPVLLIAGESDHKFRDIAVELAQSMSRARAVEVAGAGHAVHLDNPEGLAAVVLPFLASIDEQAGR